MNENHSQLAPGGRAFFSRAGIVILNRLPNFTKLFTIVVSSYQNNAIIYHSDPIDIPTFFHYYNSISFFLNCTISAMLSTTNSTEERALSLLGQGLSPEVVASGLGVSASLISQYISRPDFAAKVAELRYTSLAKHNIRDDAYNDLEDDLIQKLKDCLPYMVRPMEIVKAIQVINKADRRGASAPDHMTKKQDTVQLVMPTLIHQHFTTNIHNQVIKAGEQELVTVQSARMDKLLERMKGPKNVEITNST